MQRLVHFNINSISRLRHAVTMTFLTALLFTISAPLSPNSWAQGTLSPAAKEALQEGIAAAKFKNWDSAQKYFDDALIAAPGAPEVLFNLGLLNDRKGGAELVASAWFRAYLAATPAAQNRAQVEARLIELHASAEATAAKYLATAKEATKQLLPTPVSDNSCIEIADLVRGETINGHFGSVDEIIDWSDQGSISCHGFILYNVVEALFVLERPHEASRDQEASRYIEKILDNSSKTDALITFATVKWRQGDKMSAIKLVEKADAVAIQQNEHVQHLSMAFAWSLVRDGTKALRSLERFASDGHLEYSIKANGDHYESVVRYVVAALILSEKEKEAKAAISAITSRLHDDKLRKRLLTSYNAILDELKSRSQKDLIALTEILPIYNQLWRRDEPRWSEQEFSVKSARESGKTEQDYWIDLAKGPSALFADVYSDGRKFLVTASGSDIGNAVEILSVGAIDLLLGSRKIKQIAADWRKEGGGSAQ